jgi:hypothetical protein
MVAPESVVEPSKPPAICCTVILTGPVPVVCTTGRTSVAAAFDAEAVRPEIAVFAMFYASCRM